MRVTSNTYTNGLIEQLNTMSGRQSKLQTRISTGQRVQTPSDDPAAMRRVMDLQNETRAIAQFQSNISTEQARANVAFGAIKSIKSISDRAGEIATLADGLKSPAELKDYGAEVAQLLKQAVQVANTKYNGSSLFAGTRNDQEAFSALVDSKGDISSVIYQGNQNVAQSQIAENIQTTSQVVGANSTGSGPAGLITDSSTGADFFNHLISLQQHLISGDVDSIANTDRAQLTNDEDNFLFHISNNGAVQDRLDTSAVILKTRAATLNSQVSQEADVDLATTLVHLNATQNAYQATLQSGAKLMSLSLMDYLH